MGVKVVLAADGADDVLVLGDESVHLVEAHGVHVHLGVLLADELVGAVAGLAGAAVQQRVREAGDVAGGHPGLRVHDDGGIEPDVIGALLHEFFQPCLFDVVLELDAQRAVVPAVGKTAVDLGTGEHITTVLAEIDDHIKGLFALFHCSTSFPSAAGLPCRCCCSGSFPHCRACFSKGKHSIFTVPCFAPLVKPKTGLLWGTDRFLHLFMVFHSCIDGAGTVDLFREHKAGQLVGHGDASHAELECSGLFHLIGQAVDEPITKATSPAPLFARSARNCASSSEEICLPSMHMATMAAPLRTLDRMALPSLSSAFFTTASEAFFSSIFSSGSSMMRKDAKAARRFWYWPRPRRNILHSACPHRSGRCFALQFPLLYRNDLKLSPSLAPPTPPARKSFGRRPQSSPLQYQRNKLQLRNGLFTEGSLRIFRARQLKPQ